MQNCEKEKSRSWQISGHTVGRRMPNGTKGTRDSLVKRGLFAPAVQPGDSIVKPHDENPTYQTQSGEVIPNETVASSSCDEQRDYGHAALAVMR